MRSQHRFKKYRDLSLYSKISIVIWGFALLMVLCIIFAATFYYYKVQQSQTIKNAQSTTLTAATAISDNYCAIVERFVSTCSTQPFLEDIEKINNPSSTYLTSRIFVQEELSTLSGCNYLVYSAVIISRDGSTCYSLYERSLRTELLPFFSDSEKAEMYGIYWLPERSSPFYSAKEVVSLVFCVTLNKGTPRLSTSPDEPADAYIVIMLDTNTLSNILTLSDKSGSRNTFLLATSDGKYIYSNDGISRPDILEDSRTLEFLSNISSDSSGQSSVLTTDSYHLIGTPISNPNVVLLSYIEQDTLLDIWADLIPFVMTVSIVVLLLLLVISIWVKQYISAPVNKLIMVVNQIENGTYHNHVKFFSRDEMGTLCHALNTMHDTIEEQMVQIKQEEAQKFNAQIQLLTEQINPHFLYNTLDCIQYEVKQGNTQSVSNMIQYLAEYMRIGLSYGRDLISISNELKHVHAYVKIMNQRFQQSITLTYRVDPSLEQVLIPKTILQPLAENSIKHGFNIDHTGTPTSFPTIEILFAREDNQLHIQIIDNGAGFDVSQTEHALYHGKTGHVGLHNVYLRLVTYYGKENVQCTLSSVPYYQNSISFYVPLNQLLEEK